MSDKCVEGLSRNMLKHAARHALSLGDNDKASLLMKWRERLKTEPAESLQAEIDAEGIVLEFDAPAPVTHPASGALKSWLPRVERRLVGDREAQIAARLN